MDALTIKPLSKPKWLYTDEQLNKLEPSRLGGWRPPYDVRWYITDMNLARTKGYDLKEDHFDCLVQFRVNAVDALSFGGIRAGELIIPKHELDPRKTTLLQAARLMAKTEEPDHGLSLGRLVTVDAMYHDAWVAVPFNWKIHREAVLDDASWSVLLENISIDEIKSGTTKLVPIENAISSRVSLYSTAHHSMWRVGDKSFFVPPAKRSYPPTLDLSRMPMGWTEKVERFEYDAIPGVEIDPSRRPKGDTLRHLTPHATDRLRRELLDHGIRPI